MKDCRMIIRFTFFVGNAQQEKPREHHKFITEHKVFVRTLLNRTLRNCSRTNVTC